MHSPELCTEADITWMVHAFYGRIRADALLGPVFAARIGNWDEHLPKMVDFWSSALRGTARYRGTPMASHVALPGLDAGMFQHWLALFRQTTAELDNEAMRERANELAGRIAQSLWYGYQLHRDAEAMPDALEVDRG